jgi:hypothetical protein
MALTSKKQLTIPELEAWGRDSPLAFDAREVEVDRSHSLGHSLKYQLTSSNFFESYFS